MAINTKKFAGVVQATLAEKYDTTVANKDCEKFVNAVLDSITACLADGESVKFTGFISRRSYVQIIPLATKLYRLSFTYEF